jgi:hypothetical protein
LLTTTKLLLLEVDALLNSKPINECYVNKLSMKCGQYSLLLAAKVLGFPDLMLFTASFGPGRSEAAAAAAAGLKFP